ncbi:heme-binding beta-barrel domain-containing protein [Mesosutterella sp. AGMB02718]|uniref:Heme-binding beta-barrel domain-containing protein n=1 Tax=Mesosutterella faecium TaxID=2925194 RepID=A0ABT7IKH3_9BURK|nr:heme-binding beta-barrel domain-containing protein [Mesosutterella sp. AGMB02718]MDL2058411.1 heme-binding beta-barrel domain-containing protein [Mesosutterella sp. AGMB02718]
MENIFQEPDFDPDTRRNLGPLKHLAGVWEGKLGEDTHPEESGPVTEPYVERWEFEVIDPQTNGPQLFYGLRYHQHVTRPGELEAFHDQVGYLLWEPATKQLYMTASIPRGQTVLAVGTTEENALEWTVQAAKGDEVSGILSNPFLEKNFNTVGFSFKLTYNDDGTVSYEETTVLKVAGSDQAFLHTDRDTLQLVEAPVALNPSAIQAGKWSKR